MRREPNPKQRSKEDTGKPAPRPDEKEGDRKKGVSTEKDHNEFLRPDSRDEQSRDHYV